MQDRPVDFMLNVFPCSFGWPFLARFRFLRDGFRPFAETSGLPLDMYLIFTRPDIPVNLVLHGKLWDWCNVVRKHCVQILRSAQDDRTSIRCHPEREVGNPKGFQVRPVGRTADFQSRGLKTTPCEESVRFVTEQH